MWLWGCQVAVGWGTRSRPWNLCPNMSVLFKQGEEMWPNWWSMEETWGKRHFSHSVIRELWIHRHGKAADRKGHLARVVGGSCLEFQQPWGRGRKSTSSGSAWLCSEFQSSLSYIAIPCHKKEDRNVGLTISLKRLSNRQTWWSRYNSETPALKYLWRGVYTCKSGSGFYVTNIWRVISFMHI